MKFFTDFLKAWAFSHETENHGSKLQFWAKIGKYVVILPALIWLVLSLSGCKATYTAVTVQGITANGASAQHPIYRNITVNGKMVIFDGQEMNLLSHEGSEITAEAGDVIFKFTLKK